MTYLWHVTLDTGHVRQSPRAEADQIAVDAVALELRRALRDGETQMRVGPPKEAEPPYTLKATTEGSALIATILRPIGDRIAPIVTIGVAPKSRGAGPLWRLLHQVDHRIATDPEKVPAAPWCAVRFDVGIRHDLAATSWLGDWERLAAWAWIEKRHANA